MKTKSIAIRKSYLALSISAALSLAPKGNEALAQEEQEASGDETEAIVVTGSRIERRDFESNSPLITISQQDLEDNAFVSIEEALNDLPQFMVGGPGMSGAAVTTLQGANGVDGGRGTGDMFNMSLLPDNAGMIGIVVPGAANVNLRGLGANRALTLVNGHRAMPINASMTVDLNTIPAIAIAGIEVISGGASAVYGSDALAGVTNIKLRENFEGISVRLRGGANEVGDGEEWQFGTLIGSDAGERAHVVFGLEYTDRSESLWAERDHFREVMESPYSGSGDYLFAWEPFYSPGGATGTFNLLQRTWGGNSPSLAAINNVFSDRTCLDGNGVQLNCVAANNAQGIATLTGNPGPALFAGYHFNADGTLFVRGSQVGTGANTVYYGPQSYNNPAGGTEASPNEIACTFFPTGVSAYAPFAGEPCNPSSGNRVDYGRWLTLPREAYTLFSSGTFDFDNGIQAFASFNFASSDTVTRREPAPYQGGFGAMIPFGTNEIYLPSIVQVPTAGQAAGATRPEYRVGGTKGTNCPDTGGCTMAQAFPVPAELRTLLQSRPTPVIGSTGANANNPFRGLSDCNIYSLALNPGAPGTLVNPASGASYTVQMDPNTGLPLNKCGPASAWQVNQQLTMIPPRGTSNTGRLYQLAGGLRGDLGTDWNWEVYMSQGDSQTHTAYDGFSSMVNYMKIISAPNYGKGYVENGAVSKYMTCTSGLNPFDPNLVVSADCIEAVQSNQVDRNIMTQRVYEGFVAGSLADMPAGPLGAAFGATYRDNDYQYFPDSQRERDYTNDASAGQFASGSIDESVSVKEVYGELRIPLLAGRRIPNSFELEVGARASSYSTGQDINTYKFLTSFTAVESVRLRGGYNRAERAPNMSELYATPSGSSQFASAPSDPCRNNALVSTATGGANNNPNNPNRAQLQMLCSEQINFWGGNNATDFHNAPDTFDIAGGAALIVGNPDLANEKADTWTFGLTFSPPSTSIIGSVDWYRVRIKDPIEVQQTATIVNSCFNVNGLNPTYALDDARDFCDLIERDPSTGAIVRVYNSFGNQGLLEIRGVDTTLAWNTDVWSGTLTVNTMMNFIIDQVQRYGADLVDDYAGFGGASKFRAVTGVSYGWGNGHRISLNWNYRDGTDSPTTFATTYDALGTTAPRLHVNEITTGYPSTSIFELAGSTFIGERLRLNLSISNLFNEEPRPGGYDIRDPRAGFGSFSPFDDLVGRRYLLTVTMDF
jgi:outer membrane receptor protein involved in Fe transport